MFRPKPKYDPGDLVIYNKDGEFGDERDRLFQICHRKYGTCNDTFTRQWWYSGNILRMEKHESVGLPQIPVTTTGLHNAPEENMRKIEKAA